MTTRRSLKALCLERLTKVGYRVHTTTTIFFRTLWTKSIWRRRGTSHSVKTIAARLSKCLRTSSRVSASRIGLTYGILHKVWASKSFLPSTKSSSPSTKRLQSGKPWPKPPNKTISVSRAGSLRAPLPTLWQLTWATKISLNRSPSLAISTSTTYETSTDEGCSTCKCKAVLRTKLWWPTTRPSCCSRTPSRRGTTPYHLWSGRISQWTMSRFLSSLWTPVWLLLKMSLHFQIKGRSRSTRTINSFPRGWMSRVLTSIAGHSKYRTSRLSTSGGSSLSTWTMALVI